LSFLGFGKRAARSFPVSPENRFLIACTSTYVSPERILELITPDLDWQRILRRAGDYGVAPLLYFHLKKSAMERHAPPEFLHQLRLLYRESCVQAINQSVRLQEILVALSRKGVSPIVMKGAALGALIYQTAGLRPMLDIDLLVRSADVDAAANVLAELGYVSDESYQSAEWYKNHHHHLAPFIKPDQSVVVELHRQMVSPRANVSIPIEEFWERAREAQIASVPALVLAPEDLLLGICIHIAISQRFEKALRDLADIAEVIRAYRSEIDWDQLVYNAIKWGAASSLYYCLWAAQLVTETVLPPNLLKKLRPETGLSMPKDASLKFLIPRAIFPDSTKMKVWLINDLLGEILCPQIGITAILTGRLREYFEFTPSNSRQIAQ
jgi:hypothetical protein